MANMSFALTTEQIRQGTKKVTRRIGWRKAKPGQRITAVVKGMGLKKGEKVKRLREIEIVRVSFERLDRMLHDPAYGREEVRLEGFPEMTPAEFVAMFCEHNGICQEDEVTRIEFRYVSEAKR